MLRLCARGEREMNYRLLPLIALTTIFTAGVASAQARAGSCPLDSVEFHKCALEKAKTFNPPRTPDGKPDFHGYWTARHNGAVWDIEPRKGEGSLVPATSGVIVDMPDRKIPYQPWALARRDELRKRPFDDPKGHCAPSPPPSTPAGASPRMSRRCRNARSLARSTRFSPEPA